MVPALRPDDAFAEVESSRAARRTRLPIAERAK
jgi:hypothetical protein